MTKSVRRRLIFGVFSLVLLTVLSIVAVAGVFGPTAQTSVKHLVERGSAAYFWVLERQNHFALLGTVLAIIVGSYGTYKVLIGWNTVRRQLFKSYLEDEEKGIANRKTAVSKHLQIASRQSERFNTVDVNHWINDAVTEFDAGKLDDAKATLKQLNHKLQERIDFAASQARIAQKQQAAVHLFLGSIEAAQFKPNQAISEFERSLSLSNGQDADAFKYIAEQKLALSEGEPRTGVGSVHAQVALEAAQKMEGVGSQLGDKRIQAEALLLQGRSHLRSNGRTAARDRANDGINKMEDISRAAVPNTEGHLYRDDNLCGQLRELLGDAQVLLGAWNQADAAYAGAISFFQKFDAERKSAVERKRARATQRETDEALRPWPHPNGIRLEETS